MLTRALTRAAAVIAAVAAVTGLWVTPARAGGSPGGVFGGTQCGQSNTPGCTVTAGTAGGGTGGGTLTAAGPGGGCAGTVNKTFGCVPAGCAITVQTLTCPIGFGGPPGGAPDPAALAQLAVRLLRLPDPVIEANPAPAALQLTWVPTWLWITPAVWQAQSATARVPGMAVTATATPVSASWRMGDGRTVTCYGPGTPYSSGANPAAPSPDCGYTYTRSSAGLPGSAYKVTVTITWAITWTASGGPARALPQPLFTTAMAPMRVAESQAVNTTGGP